MYSYEPVEEELNALSIYAVSSSGDHGNKTHDQWSVCLRTPYQNSKGAVKMKIDTQAHCNTLCKTTFDRMAPHGNLKLVPSDSTITAFGNSVIAPVGKTSFEVIVKGETHVIECEVIDDVVPNLLGAKDSERLGLIKRVYSVENNDTAQTTCKSVPKETVRG